MLLEIKEEIRRDWNNKYYAISIFSIPGYIVKTKIRLIKRLGSVLRDVRLYHGGSDFDLFFEV